METLIKVVLLACEQACPRPQLWIKPLAEAGLKVRMVQEPCSSKVEVFQLLRLLARSADLVWVVACPEELCRLCEGSIRMERRLAHAQDYLEEIGLERERLGLSLLAAEDEAGRGKVIDTIRAQAQSLGINPGCRQPSAGKE